MSNKALAQKIVRDVLSIDYKTREGVELAVYRTQSTLDGFTWTLVGFGSVGWLAVLLWILLSSGRLS